MGIIYRACAAVLNRLPADEHGRRVFDETLADWRREPNALLGVVGAARAVAGVSVREVASSAMGHTLLRVMAWSSGWAILGVVLSHLAYGWVRRPVSELAAWSVIGVVFFLPTAILLSSITRRRPVPALGLALASAVAGLLLVGWASPAANHVIFGSVDMFMLSGSGWAERSAGDEQVFRMFLPKISLEHVSGRFAHDLPGLVAAGPPNGWPALQLVSFSAAFICLCALMPCIGSALRHRSALGRRVAVTAAFLFVFYRGQIADAVAPDWVLWSFVAPWLPVAVLAATILWTSGPRDSGTSSPRYRMTASNAFSATSSTAADPAVK
jgi:hypothetical protein